MNKIIKRIFTLAVTLCLGVLPMLAQNAKTGQADKILNGIVIGSDGDTPLAGVVIHSKENPKEIATTDANGEYKFSVSPTTETVVFEMMGYDTKEIKVADTYLFTLVTMIVQANALEESVVVGFGTQKKRIPRGCRPGGEAGGSRDILLQPHDLVRRKYSGTHRPPDFG